MTLIVRSETTPCVDLTLLNTLMQAILNLLFFPTHKNGSIRYQTRLRQYRSFFHNLPNYIFFLKTFDLHQKTNSQNLLFQKFSQYFQKLHRLLVLFQFSWIGKLAKALPILFVLKRTSLV